MQETSSQQAVRTRVKQNWLKLGNIREREHRSSTHCVPCNLMDNDEKSYIKEEKEKREKWGNEWPKDGHWPRDVIAFAAHFPYIFCQANFVPKNVTMNVLSVNHLFALSFSVILFRPEKKSTLPKMENKSHGSLAPQSSLSVLLVFLESKKKIGKRQNVLQSSRERESKNSILVSDGQSHLADKKVIANFK